MTIKNTVFLLVYLAAIAALFWIWNPGGAGVGMVSGQPAGGRGKTWIYGSRSVPAGDLWSGRTALHGPAGEKLSGYPGQGFPGVFPAGPAAEAVKAKRSYRKKTAAMKGAGLAKKGAGLEPPGKRRKKRVSRLREPGDAMGGGVRLDMAAKKIILLRQKK